MFFSGQWIADYRMGHVADENLTDKQSAFVAEYLRNGFNATRAAIAAGYEEASARNIGCENLTKPYIRAAIKARLDTEGITPERIKIALAEIAFDGDVADVEAFIESGLKLSDIRDDGAFNTKLVKAVSRSVTAHGENRTIEMYSRLDALEKLGRVLAMFTDRTAISGSLNTDRGQDDETMAAFAEWRASQKIPEGE